MHHSIGVSNVSCPRHIVPIQLKNLMPVGTAIRNDIPEKNGLSTDARREHVVRPHGHRQPGDRHGGQHESRVPEDRLPREHRDDVGDDAEERQRHDVDLGMAEEPEQVLVQHGRAAVRRIVEVPAEVPVDEQQRQGAGRAAGTPPGSAAT